MKKVIILILLMLSFCFSQNIMAKELKFAQFSDMHLSFSDKNSKEKNNSTADYSKQAIKDINKQKDIKFVIFTGDSINKANKKDFISFLKIANKLNKPYYVVIGNREVLKYNNFNKKDFMRTVGLRNFKMAFKKPNYVFKPNKDFVFIVVDGTNEIMPSTGGYFRPETLEWLDKKLQKYKNKKIVLVQHYPLIPPTRKTIYNTVDVEKYFYVINGYDNVIAVLSGHFHKDNVIYKKGIYHMSAPAFNKTPYEYKVVTIDYEPKYLFSNPAEFLITQELIQMEKQTDKMMTNLENDTEYEIKEDK